MLTIINACLGICIAAAMWALVMFLAAAVSFTEPGAVIAVPIAYFALTTIEGNVVAAAVLGGRFRINPLVAFVWIFAWAGFWGIAGMLIAMPALVIFKIVCENTDKI
jgi:predicted PurR-regulated permease PerM